MERILRKIRALRGRSHLPNEPQNTGTTPGPENVNLDEILEDKEDSESESEWEDDLEDTEELLLESLEIFLKDLNKSEDEMDGKRKELLNLCEQLIQIQEERNRNRYTISVLDDEISKSKDMIGHLTQLKQTEMELKIKVAEPILYSDYISISSAQGAKDFLSGLQDKQQNLDNLRKLAVLRLSRLSSSEKSKPKRKDKQPKSSLAGSSKKGAPKLLSIKKLSDQAQTYLSTDDRLITNPNIPPATIVVETPAAAPVETSVETQAEASFSLDIFEPRPLPTPVPSVSAQIQSRSTAGSESPTIFFRDPLAEALVNGLSLTDLNLSQGTSTPSSLSVGVSWSAVASLDSINLEVSGSAANAQQGPTQERSQSSPSVDNDASSQRQTDV